MLEQKWFVQFLYDFDDNKVLKNNWIYYLFNCAGSLNISIKYWTCIKPSEAQEKLKSQHLGLEEKDASHKLKISLIKLCADHKTQKT